MSTGKSSLDAVDALREMEVEVLGMAAIFSYGFKVSEDNFQNSNCKLVTLSNYDALIENAVQTGYIEKNLVDFLKGWRKDPSNWGK